jgi:hypothetical protein
MILSLLAVTNYFMKYFKFTILFSAVLGMIFLGVASVKAATQCSSLSSQYGGTNCQTSCSGSYPVSASAGDEGCKEENSSWVCCGKTSSGSTSGSGSISETATIFDDTVDVGSLDGFMKVALNVSKFILGITGSASLAMFVYGGVMFLISAGSSEKVTQAKGILVGAVIGLFIVFASYMIIGFAINTMGATSGSEWAGSGWF